MGKTNLLDAVYYLCMCKSHFGVKDNYIKRHQSTFFRLEGHFKKEKKSYKTVAKVIPREKKEFELNDVVYSKLATHIGTFPVVMITPFDIELAMEGSEIRRKFLDNTLSQIDATYLSALMKYNRLLKQRNIALKRMEKMRMVDDGLLDVFDSQLLEPAQLIHQKRAAFNEQFLPIFQEYYAIISKDQEKVSYTYRSQLLEGSLAELLQNNRQKDVLLQRTTVGIHKDDLVFKIEGFPLKKFASQGQLKSFILALKLAQYALLRKEKSCPPLLLLDDIFDKLDRQRAKQLIRLLFERKFGQIFFTDTHKGRLKEILEELNIDFKQFIVKFGEIVEE
jgi:DNA replication and repair protein RecF